MCEPRRSDCKAVILKPTNHAKFFYLAVVLLLAAYAFLSNMSINVYVVPNRLVRRVNCTSQRNGIPYTETEWDWEPTSIIVALRLITDNWRQGQGALTELTKMGRTGL